MLMLVFNAYASNLSPVLLLLLVDLTLNLLYKLFIREELILAWSGWHGSNAGDQAATNGKMVIDRGACMCVPMPVQRVREARGGDRRQETEDDRVWRGGV